MRARILCVLRFGQGRTAFEGIERDRRKTLGLKLRSGKVARRHILRSNEMSIATKRGDGGQTGLVGGVRVSKADLRVEAYGSVDELNSVLGFARSICQNADIRAWTEWIQKALFRLGSALATPPEAKNPSPAITAGDVEQLTTLVHTIEGTKGTLSDWSLPGAQTEAAAFEMARTVGRRAERNVVRLAESGAPVDSQVLGYLNRLSDVLWLFGRLLELNAGVDSGLRADQHAGARFSRAW
jgi:cob(I)alamin adenosyltransferase